MESELGKGSTVTIYFPLVMPAPSLPIRAVDELTDLHGTETILLVEDDESFRELLCTSLRGNGYVVIEASDGLKGIAAAKANRHIDLLLTDVVMPKLSGPKAAKRIRVLHPAIKVIYVSGYAEDLINMRTELGPDIVLMQKPFAVDSLLMKIREQIEKPLTVINVGEAT